MFVDIQLDESIDVTVCSKLLVFARYIHETNFKDEIFLRKILDIITIAENVFEITNNFFEEHGLDWVSLVGITTDGAPAMLDSSSDL